MIGDIKDKEQNQAIDDVEESKPIDIEDEILNDLTSLSNPDEFQTEKIADISSKQAKRIFNKMEKVAVAPGEFGSFKNWGEDIFLEEKCFPEKFPFGVGGYLSSSIDDPEKDMGFASYCVNQIMSCDPKFRNDSTYLFFLLLVKELVMLKRCKTTYLRQATRTPNLTKTDVLNLKHENINRYNRSFEVFKNMRGTSMYYEESKKNLMAHLRQNGCPTFFFTMSCAEFDWRELLKEIMETVYRRNVTDEEIDNLSTSEKNKLISGNYVQSTLHFQKRVEKIFTLFKSDNFFGVCGDHKYHVSSYFYRIEFQQRGAPHLHSLLWLKDENDDDAPSFWNEEDHSSDDEEIDNEDQRCNVFEEKKERIAKFVDYFISTSPADMRCKTHSSNVDLISLYCEDCKILQEKVSKYQTHGHTFTCSKKGKTITIKENEGHGRYGRIINKNELRNIPVCRFNIPKFPMDKTRLILAMRKDLDKEVVSQRTKDLIKIKKYLIRQTFSESTIESSESWSLLKKMNFLEFLYDVGMFDEEKGLKEYDQVEINKAIARYCNAISASVKGRGVIILKREVKDIFINGFNKFIMLLHIANHDFQPVIDHYGCAQYVCGYLTKNEAGISKLLKAVNDESANLKQMEKLNKLAAVLDKHREVSSPSDTSKDSG